MAKLSLKERLKKREIKKLPFEGVLKRKDFIFSVEEKKIKNKKDSEELRKKKRKASEFFGESEKT